MAQTERDYSHRSLIDKLGVKPGHGVCLCGALARDFVDVISGILEKRPATSARGTYDIVFLQIDTPDDLQAIASLAEHLEASGGLWIFHPKGKGASPNDAEVRTAGLAAGLVDNKICAYNQTHTATRYVIPKARR